ncbi:DUF1887 family protein [Betaproteobacteria bacterium PRO4]|uniref:Card1-like endonuclease domain-containing protein n=1 Tax=Nitrosomonas sp. TaxID=42353 RepID=UPI00255E47C0|nr:DUF1887 family CARF protein [Nitrosomonas sp.]MBE7527280.1 DUF1887 family protein [Burkholderiales bacterium]MDL1866448.1 DUF1887 family protein [Betaproteobacteria bacterium PRO4]
MTVHVCLVSAQAAPNLLPVLDPELKPEEVVLLTSQKMRNTADALRAVFTELGIRSTIIPLADEHNYQAIEETMLQIAGEREGQEIALNLTGGTKLMALVAQTVAQTADWRSFYVDADTDSITWLGHRQMAGKKLAEQLRLRHYLKAYGFDLEAAPERPQATREQRDLMQTLINQIGSLETSLTQLNWLTQQAEDGRHLEVKMDAHQADSRSLEALLRNFEEAGMLQIKQNTICYPDETARSFVKGGWLELYTYDCVARVTGDLGIRDKAANLTVNNRGVKNEMDIALLARNRLFVIECKTARMDKPQAPKANDTLFKLAEICRRVGGLGTRGMLASYRPVADSERKLAGALNITLVTGRDLIGLPDRIKAWIQS